MPLYNPSSSSSIPAGVDDTELGYLDGVTSAIQTQLTAKIAGSTGGTDNVLLRSDGTGGKTLQNSTVTLGDTGAISNITTADVINLTLQSSVGQTADLLKILYQDGSTPLLRVTNGGKLHSNLGYYHNDVGFDQSTFTTYALGGRIDFNTGSSNPAFNVVGSTSSFDFSTLFGITVNKATNRGLLIKGYTAQSANLLEARDSSDAVLSKIGPAGKFEADSGLTVGSGETISKIQTGTISVTVPALTAGDIGDDSSTITGLADGDFVFVTPPNAAFEDGLTFSCYVSAPNTLTICLVNSSTSTLAGSTENWRYLVIKA